MYKLSMFSENSIASTSLGKKEKHLEILGHFSHFVYCPQQHGKGCGNKIMEAMLSAST